MAAGAPVIAYAAGGALETVTPKTGVFFNPQTVEALMEAIEKIEQGTQQPAEAECRERARHFTRERFQREFATAVREAWAGAGKDAAVLEEVLQKGWAAKAALGASDERGWART
jgi:glycosyltransferase involved in cell wall biosynthesis